MHQSKYQPEIPVSAEPSPWNDVACNNTSNCNTIVGYLNTLIARDDTNRVDIGYIFVRDRTSTIEICSAVMS